MDWEKREGLWAFGWGVVGVSCASSDFRDSVIWFCVWRSESGNTLETRSESWASWSWFEDSRSLFFCCSRLSNWVCSSS